MDKIISKILGFFKKKETPAKLPKHRSKRTNLLYGNISVYSMDGDLIFECDDKKSNWYLERNLAKKIGKNKIQLTFKNKGRGDEKEILEIERRNVCAECGCGNINILTKHHIVPYSFRKFLPKDRKSILLIPLCSYCHDKYEIEASKFRKEICKKYGVSFNRPKLSSHEKTLFKIGKKTKALSNPNVPVEHKESITNEIELLKKKYYDESGKEWHNGLDSNPPEYLYSKELVKKITNEQEKIEFERLWIRHVLEHMELKYLDPKHIEYLKNY